MVDVTVSTVFDAPRELVARVAGDPSMAPRWFSNLGRCTRLDDPPVRVGTEAAFEARSLGRSIPCSYRVTELVPDERMVLRTESGPFPMETTLVWWDEEAEDGGPRTGMSLRNHGRPRAMTTLASGGVTLTLRRAMRRDLERLRLLLREVGTD